MMSKLFGSRAGTLMFWPRGSGLPATLLIFLGLDRDGRFGVFGMSTPLNPKTLTLGFFSKRSGAANKVKFYGGFGAMPMGDAYSARDDGMRRSIMCTPFTALSRIFQRDTTITTGELSALYRADFLDSCPDRDFTQDECLDLSGQFFYIHRTLKSILVWVYTFGYGQYTKDV